MNRSSIISQVHHNYDKTNKDLVYCRREADLRTTQAIIKPNESEVKKVIDYTHGLHIKQMKQIQKIKEEIFYQYGSDIERMDDRDLQLLLAMNNTGPLDLMNQISNRKRSQGKLVDSKKTQKIRFSKSLVNSRMSLLDSNAMIEAKFNMSDYGLGVKEHRKKMRKSDTTCMVTQINSHKNGSPLEEEEVAYRWRGEDRGKTGEAKLIREKIGKEHIGTHSTEEHRGKEKLKKQGQSKMVKKAKIVKMEELSLGVKPEGCLCLAELMRDKEELDFVSSAEKEMFDLENIVNRAKQHES
eukprot:CAMPEP_0170539664 /NCGR_PEP_ID=MMETSP0209-20121228/104096_1 /TAXON_ID=665100 ORGANISM="Litonotus pictus, Strain P1" /NCGR_SAMPLE_ID=MMETSP0209 /ASSEMBLY_ACC=CAM_ASM_000301 /LENGTH=296 /DNA_ID=CAMNT_0010841697 /DNA_START=110 /DNA_END=997 /DNA_ORIENTATION=-